jgi:hypothetical protein
MNIGILISGREVPGPHAGWSTWMAVGVRVRARAPLREGGPHAYLGGS